jgi:hypothetical protein
VAASPSGKGEACIGDLLIYERSCIERKREKKVGEW